MPALTVIKSLRNGALALALIGGAALLPQAASADSFQESGDFGGTWSRIGPGDQTVGAMRRHYARADLCGAGLCLRVGIYYEPGYYGPPAL